MTFSTPAARTRVLGHVVSTVLAPPGRTVRYEAHLRTENGPVVCRWSDSSVAGKVVPGAEVWIEGTAENNSKATVFHNPAVDQVENS